MPMPGARALEIGSGLGWVMQAALEQVAPRQMIGLDVAPTMIEKARARLRRDGVTDPRLDFLLYDGVTIPLPDDSVDWVYSVAALQHVPKVYVYNLLLEIKRILSPAGFCTLHLLSVANIPGHSKLVPFAQEIGSQLHGEDTHWHHFYAFDELLYVLAGGVEARQIEIVDGEVSIWTSFAKTGPMYHRPELPDEAHLRRGQAAATTEDVAPAPDPPVAPVPSKRLTLSRVLRAAAGRLVGGAMVSLRPGPAPLDATLAGGPTSVGRDYGPEIAEAIRTGRWPQDPALLPWYDQADYEATIVRLRHHAGLGPDDAAMLRKWAADGYVVVPRLVPDTLIDAFVDEIDDVWTRHDAIDGLNISDVDLGDGTQVHVPHRELVALSPSRRQEIKADSNWRVGGYHLFSEAARRI